MLSTHTRSATIETVFFDLDGTLVDNFKALHKAFAHAHAQLGLEAPSYEKVLRTVGGSAPVTMERLLGDTEQAQKAMPIFEAYFKAHMFDGIETLAGTQWLLDALQKQGKRMAVFTNKDGDVARDICKHLNLMPYLDAVMGAGDTSWRKPERPFTQYALETMQAKAETSAMVGDSPFDLQAAQACGMQAWLVSTGTHDTEHLKACQPPADGVFEDLYQLGATAFGLPRVD